MKQFFMLMLATVFTGTMLQAQAQPKQKPFWVKENMDTIGIKPEVQEKITVIKDKANEEIKLVRKDEKLGEEEKKAKVKALNKKKEDDIMALLSPDVKQKVKELKKKLKEDN
jgi:hypothetical protein